MSDFDYCITEVLKHEGGYSNNVNDLGGETNLGVTHKTYTEYCMEQDFVAKDMKDLTKEDVSPIYKTKFWNAMKCDDIPSGLNYFLFDFGVNCGPFRAIKKLQRCVGTLEDGIIGPQTIAQIFSHDVQTIINDLCIERQKHYESLDSFKHFGNGWTRRNKEVRNKSIEMIK
tara:strand:- start:1960 stop:2472 length:513 start_codon:yes stop_codon:yes gene_type:complete